MAIKSWKIALDMSISKVINIYETKNPSTLPSMSSTLIYFQSLIQSEASDSLLATRSSQNSRLLLEYVAKLIVD
jgi:hypothetical protein